MKRPLNRTEKWLFAAPVALILIAGAVAVMPSAFRRATGWPLILSSRGGESIETFAWTQNGRSLALCIGEKDGNTTPDTAKVRVFDAENGHELREGVVKTDARFRVNASALVPYRNGWLARISPDDGGRLFDASTGESRGDGALFSVGRIVGPVRVHFSADFNRALVISFSDAQMWQRTSKGWTPALKLGESDSFALQALARDGQSALLISNTDAAFRKNIRQKNLAYTGHKLRRVTTRTGKVNWQLPFHNVSAAVFSRDEKTVCFGVSEPEPSEPHQQGMRYRASWVGAVNAKTGALLWKSRKWARNRVYSLSVAPRGESLAVQHGLEISLIDPKNGEIKRELPVKPALDRSKAISLTNQLHFSPDAKSLAVNLDGHVYVWNVE